MLKLTTTLLIMATAPSNAFAQSWGSWQSETPLPTAGVAKTHAVVVERAGRLYALGGAPWTNGTIEDGSVYSMPLGGGLWVEELGFDGYGYLLGQGGGIDNLGRIVIFGGDNFLEPGNGNKPPFEWDEAEGPWHDLAPRGSQAPLTHFAWCVDSADRVYSIGGGPTTGGTAGNTNSAYCERYIGSSDTWEPIAPMPSPLADAAAALDGLGHILVFGGIVADGSARSTDVLSYDIAANTWSATANAEMPVALSAHRASLGADGRVYVIGGVSGPIGSGTTERRTHVYDPNTDTWAVGPDMAEPRSNFGAFLASDDRIYVVGGENATGGSFGVESLYGTPCPAFNSQPASASLWKGATLNLSVGVSGGGTITYAWTHDGTPVTDGPSSGGSTISGAETNALKIESIGAADAGEYVVFATNSCGTAESEAASVAVAIPPAIPEHWTFTSLHPSYADSSSANSVENGVQVGYAAYDTPNYNGIDHPTIWTGTAASAHDLTQPGSEGGVISSMSGDKLVGWWWEPISCYVNHQWQTCYYRRAGWWNLDGTFHSTNYSGFEYTLMSDTDGTTVVGTGAYDDESGNSYGRAVIWQAPTHEFALSLHPSGYRNSSATAVDGNDQFGSASLPFAVVHAAKWSGSAATFVDMHPAGATNSTIVDAEDGQQIGYINQWSNAEAMIWYGTPESAFSINPAGATRSIVSACTSGLQIGSATFTDGMKAGIWAGSADSFTSLADQLPSNYAGLNLMDIDIADDGTISLVGNAQNLDLGRLEAVLLTSTTAPPVCPADLDQNGLLDLTDINLFVNGFVSQSPIADLDGNGIYDLADVNTFVGLFAGGCP